MVQDQPSVSIKHHGFKIVQARPSALAQDHGQEPAGWGFPEQRFFSGILPNKSRVAKIISMELVLICSTADKTVPFIAGPEIWIGKSFFLQGVAQLKTVSDKAINLQVRSSLRKSLSKMDYNWGRRAAQVRMQWLQILCSGSREN